LAVHCTPGLPHGPVSRFPHTPPLDDSQLRPDVRCRHPPPYLPLSQIVGVPFEPAYQAISWLCWVPNLLVGEWLIRSARGSA
jgi:hypothetical protein